MKIHILGICGAMTTPLALALVNQGHQITGSDQQKIYPPFSTLLHQAKIKINSQTITKNIDLAIIGSSYLAFENTKVEFDQIKKLNIPYISATNYLAQHLCQQNSIIIAGSYGKTTITSLVAWILYKAKFNPSYFFGGQAINRFPSLKLTSSDWSVIEGDESINGLDTKAKFLHYPIKYVILTSADWEHKDSYTSETQNLEAFRHLLAKIPPNGVLIYNPHNQNIQKILSSCHAPAIPYHQNLKFSTALIGQHNFTNIIAAYTLCQYLGVKESTILSAIKSYRGIARRLQILKTINGITFIDDFAQSPARVQAAIEAVAKTYPHRPIKVYFEPHASFLQNKLGLTGFHQAFESATEIVLSKINFSHKVDKKHRVSSSEFAKEVGNKLKYIPLAPYIFDHYIKTLQSGDIVVHFSSGGLSGLTTFRRIIKQFTIY